MREELFKYRERFTRIPAPLQSQILFRLGCALVSALFLALLACITADWLVIIPFAGLCVYSLFCAYKLFQRCAEGGYVIIRGRCAEVENTIIRQRTKAVMIEAEEQMVRIILRQRLMRIRTGAEIQVYIADNTPIFEKGGAMLLNNYLAIELMGEELNAKSKRPITGS